MHPVNGDLALFGRYMQIVGTPSLEFASSPDPGLAGKRLGIVNGSSWVSLFANYFGQRILPGVKLINTGSDAVQLNFMTAHRLGQPCPPQVNIDLFVRYSRELVELYGVDAILISCSTMNRAADSVRRAMAGYRVPVIQIDQAMMEAAVAIGGRTLVIATHGPTVKNTMELLAESAARVGKAVDSVGATVEGAFELLGEGAIEAHNQMIADSIRNATARHEISCVVLAQLSMSVFQLSYPDSESAFGIPVLTSGQSGFERVRDVLKGGDCKAA